MRILILNWRDPKNPKSGGAEYVTLKHASAWVKAGHSVDWFTSQFPDSKEKESIEGVRIIRKGSSLTVFFFAPLYYLFSKKKYDVVIDEIHGIPFFTPLYVRTRKIAFIHEVAGEIWDHMYPFPISLIGKSIESVYFRFYKNIKFWTDAQSTIEELIEHGIKKDHCLAIPCPIIKSKFWKSHRKDLEPTFIVITRLVKMKGVEDVLDSFSLIQKKFKNARLWIIGTGDAKYEQLLRRKVKEEKYNNRVKFWGRVSDSKKYELLSRAHLLLHASRKEGWGLVILEAGSQGTPSIAYNVNGLKDVVKNGETGLLINENNPKSLADAAIALMGNKRLYKTMQRESKLWANSFSWEKSTELSLKYIA